MNLRKKLLTCIIALAAVIICFVVLPADAQAASVDDLTFNLNSDGASYSVTNCSRFARGELVIPATYNGKPVTTIGYWAFGECYSLTSITIPDSVTTIGDYAFYYCRDLTSITIPDSVTTIGDSAFCDCTSLTSITIPDSVTWIAGYAFQGCTSLTSVTIGKGADIDYSAFFYCTSLTGIWVDEYNPWYSSDSYGVLFNKDKTKLIWAPDAIKGSYVIPNSVTTIVEFAFSDCTSLTSVTLGNGVTTIEICAFWYCNGLTSITIPDSVTSIGDDAFVNCTSLENVYYKGTQEQWNAIEIYNNNDDLTNATIVYNYGNEALNYLTFKLNSDGASYSVTDCNESVSGELVIPATYNGKPVTTIGDYAFCDCTSLTSITIPNSVTSIGKAAFKQCDYLTSVTIPDSVVSIGEDAFRHCDRLKSVVIGNGVANVGDYAFYYCVSLKSVTIGNGVASIGLAAFYKCTNITEVHISDIAAWCQIYFKYHDTYGITSNPIHYANKLYLNGEVVTDLVIPDSVTSIRDFAFYHCVSLTSLNIGDGVTRIGDRTFWSCTGLTSITFGNSLNEICPGAFYNCSSLTSITFPDNIKNISNHAFWKCTNLTSVSIPDGIENVGKDTFAECNKLAYNEYNGAKYLGNASNPYIVLWGFESNDITGYTIHPDTKLLADLSFRDCTSLNSIVIGFDVAVIGDNAFSNCTDLKTVFYKGTQEQWDAIMISGGNEHLTDATIIYNYVCDEQGHKYEIIVTVPTCTSAGYTTYTCSACGDTYTTEEAALGHDKVAQAAQAPTCTVIGWNAYETCTRCDYTTCQVIPATGHTFDRQIKDIKYRKSGATINSPALFYKVCVCGLSSKGHTDETFEYGNRLGGAAASVCKDDKYTYYVTVEEAIAAAIENGGVVELQKDLNTAKPLTITGDVTIDFGGFTYTVMDPVEGTQDCPVAVVIENGANVTLKNGRLQIRYNRRHLFNYLIENNGALTTENITLRGGNVYAPGATATILNTGALNLKAGTIVEIRVHALSTTNANVIKDASIEMKPAEGYCWLADQSTLAAHIFDQQAIANYLRISGATTTSPAIFYKSCACGESSKGYANEATFTYGMPIGSFEAKIGDAYYATIADAIAVAGEDDVIEVLKTITQGKKLEITRNVTIDFCGFTYTVGVSGEEIGAAIIVAEGVEATLRNGAVQIRYSERMNFNALIQNGGLLRVDNITLKASNACAAGAEAIKGNALTIGENVTII